MADIVETFPIFNHIYNDEEQEHEFNVFMNKYLLHPLFTNAHRTTQIRVNWSEARSVVGQHLKYHTELKQFADFLYVSTGNKSYEEAVFKLINDATTFTSMMLKIRNFMTYIQNSDPDYLYNLWNIVFYVKEIYLHGTTPVSSGKIK